jgi:MarR family transcriptional regulator, organic hydroperoxide resistance regulator
MTGDDVTDVRQVFDDLVRFETMLWGTVDDRLQKDCGVSLSSFNLMLIIKSTPNCRVFDIARALAITVGGTSQAVDRLEAAGRCVRKANPTDRRSSILELTQEGEMLVSKAAVVFDDELERLLREPLPATKFAQLSDALGILRRSAITRAGSSANPAVAQPMEGLTNA